MKKPSVTNPSRPGYSQEERKLLGRLYPQGSQAELLAAFPGRTWESICSAAARFRLKRTLPANYSRQWSTEHMELPRTHYPTQGAAFVAPLVGRPVRTVLSCASKLGVRRIFGHQTERQQGRPPRANDWLLPEKELLAKLYAGAEKETILAALPTRSWWGIQCQAAKQGLSRPSRLPVPWTEVENKIICTHYPALAARATSKLLPGRTQAATRKQACLLGIKAIRPRRAPMPKPPKEPKPAPVVAQPVKRSPGTPLLNARIEVRRKAEQQEASKPKPFVTAEQVRKLSANHPARLAYTRAAYNGPAAATEAFHTAMQQAA